MALHCVDEQVLVGAQGGPATSRAYMRADGARYIVMANEREMVLTDFVAKKITQSARTPGATIASDCDAFAQKYAAQ